MLLASSSKTTPKFSSLGMTRLLCLFAVLLGVNGNHIDTVITDLDSTVASLQAAASGRHGAWQYQKGTYSCEIRSNSVGKVDSEILRDKLFVPDSNAFVTLWVSVVLQETALIKNAPIPSDHQVRLALEAIGSYHDNNSPMGDGSMVFWPQSYNSSMKQWYCDPPNIASVGRDGDDFFNLLHKVLDDLGLEKMWNETFRDEQSVLDSMLAAFFIPPDFDDSFVNLGLGSILAMYSENSTVFQTWKSNNGNFTRLFQTLKKYAYRPFEGGEMATIDPRSYFYLRAYLHAHSKYPAAFVPTWAHSISEDNHTYFLTGMPFHVNNVDLTVGTNVVYGITATLLSNLSLSDASKWFDEDVQMIYLNTTHLIAWMIRTNFSGRPDLALAYYPSIYNFYWFTARTLNLLQSQPLPSFPVLTEAMEILAPALRGNMTADLLKRANVDEKGLVYFEDFLGNADKESSGRTVKHGEDRVCSTAVAINALLYTWMNRNEFIPSVPTVVKEVVGNASLWLANNVKKSKPFNVMFSGSVKVDEDFPYFYPANVMKFVNGSTVPPGTGPRNDVSIGVHSLIPEDQYRELLKKLHFGQTTPLDFHGYNTGSFPFWSSETFTYASAMLALTRYRDLVLSGQLPPQ